MATSSVVTPSGRSIGHRLGEPGGTVTCIMSPGELPPDTPRPARPAPVIRVDGYEILEAIGAGGMGVVFKARHKQLNRIVALKMLGRDSLSDPESHDRFQVEAEAVAKLQHPNIIQVFDVGTFKDHPADARPSPYLSLEYVDGGSLYRYTLTPQSPRHAARMIETLARAVHAAHQVGVVHRDLKPANVLLTRSGEPKIADFGLAKQMEPACDERGRYLTQLGSAVGTPEYMAPEQVDGKPATPAFDTYALGVILYELLTARLPFKGLTITETMLLVKYQEPVPPRQLQPNLPRDLETICLKCLAKSPAGRYATAGELADDLARWLDGQPIRARPVSGAERLERWAKRNPTVATLSALAILLALAGVGGVTWKWRDAVWHAKQADAKAQEARDHSLAQRWELYRANVAVASSAVKLNTLNSFRVALERAPVEHRNWEWDYYHRQLDTALRVIPLSDARTQNAEVLGRRLIVHHEDGCGLWDLDARTRVLYRTTRPGDPGWTLTPDGHRYATIQDGRLVIRSFAPDSSEVVIPGCDDPLTILRFSPDGRRVLTGTERHARVWDAATGRPVSPEYQHCGIIGVSGLSADGRVAATHDFITGVMHVWEVETGELRFALHDLHNLFGVQFSPNGDRLLVNMAYPNSVVRVWDAATGRPLSTLDAHKNNVKCIAFTPDGRRVATCSTDKTICVWDVASGMRLTTLSGHTGAVNVVAFSPDGKQLVSAADDQTVRLWDPTTGTELAVLRGHTGDVVATTFTDGGAAIASVGADTTLRYWDARAAVSNGICRGHDGFVYQVAYHPDGRHVLSAAWDGTARVWDVTTGLEKGRLDHGKGSDVFAVAVHPNGRWVATLTRDNTVSLWDFDTRELLHKWKVQSDHWKSGRLAFHPTSDLLACGCSDGTVRLMDARTRGEPIVLKGHREAVRDVAFSPDGRWLVTTGDNPDNSVRVWDVASRETVRILDKHTDGVLSAAFSRDGRTLATGDISGFVYLWDTDGWECVGELPHKVKVYGLAFSKDGSRLACGCVDNSIRLWDVARREQVAELHGHDDYVHSVAFSPDGKQLVSASGDKTVRVWDTVPARDRQADRAKTGRE
jgi:eukaryotic-like serine/threonine-protein kinase